MTLVVAVPDGYGAERRYVLDVVLSEWLGLDWRLAHHACPDVRITLADDTSDPAGCVTLPDGLFATAEDDWLTPTALPPADVPWVPVGTTFEGPLRADDRLPVLHGAPAAGPPSQLVTADDDGVQLHVDVLGGVFFLITRYEELLDAPRDRYDRYPAAASVAERAGFHDIPLADAYVELLWAALQRAWPRLTRTPSSYQVLITHDVDDPLATLGRTPALTARQLSADLVHRRDPGLAARRARAVLAARRGDQVSWEDVSPILVAEVLYASDPYKDLVRNVELYLRVPSIREYWILDGRDFRRRTDPDRPSPSRPALGAPRVRLRRDLHDHAPARLQAPHRPAPLTRPRPGDPCRSPSTTCPACRAARTGASAASGPASSCATATSSPIARPASTRSPSPRATRPPPARSPPPHGIPTVHDTIDELLADPTVEVLDVAVPPDVQPALIRQAVEHARATSAASSRRSRWR